MFKETTLIQCSWNQMNEEKQQEIMQNKLDALSFRLLLSICYPNKQEIHSRVLIRKLTWGDFILPITVIITLVAMWSIKLGIKV